MTSPASNRRTPRRDFLQRRSVAAAAGAATIDVARGAHAAGGDVLRVGLVGCGGRGRGAALNALNADPHARLVALADLYPQQIQRAIDNLKMVKGPQVAVDAEHRFVGFEACGQLLASGVDVVLLALPTYFHPIYLKACVDAGKHVFCEKIHAVDPPGVRAVLAASEEARRKGLSMVSGLAWRYDTGVRETMARVHDGAIGRILALKEICNTPSLRSLARRPGMTEMEYQIYDWYDFNWISADLPGLNLVHNLDKGAWAMHDQPPVKAWGMGGRQTRTGPTFGDVYDHHATVFEYADGTRMYAYCRQQNGCFTDVSDTYLGTKGRCNLLGNRIEGQTNWRYTGRPSNRFDLEHVALFSSIRSGKPINNGLYMARSSLLALMCTWCSYTGREITWEQAWNSNYEVKLSRVAFDAEPPTRPGPDGQYPIAMPGLTKLPI